MLIVECLRRIHCDVFIVLTGFHMIMLRLFFMFGMVAAWCRLDAHADSIANTSVPLPVSGSAVEVHETLNPAGSGTSLH